MNAGSSNWLIAHWGGNKRHVFDPVVSSLRRRGRECTWLPRNDMARREEILAAIRGGDHDVLLTWQRFYPMQRDLLDAVAWSGIKTVYMDYGFLPHYESVVFDGQGENATSSWLGEWENGTGSSFDEAIFGELDRIIADLAVRVHRMSIPEFTEAGLLRQPFVFVPLQRPNDSVIRYDSSVHDFGQLLRKVLFLAKGRFFVVCKTHPLDRDIDLGVPDVLEHSHVVIRTPSGSNNEAICEFLLSRASLVVSVNSNMLFRAMLYGTPVIATGRGWYTGSNAVHEVNGVAGLNDLLVKSPCPERQRHYLATCLSRQLHFSELNDPLKCANLFTLLGLPI